MFGRSAANDEVASREKNDASKIENNVFMDFESKKCTRGTILIPTLIQYTNSQ